MREMQVQFFDEGLLAARRPHRRRHGHRNAAWAGRGADSLIQGSWKTVRDLTITALAAWPNSASRPGSPPTSPPAMPGWPAIDAATCGRRPTAWKPSSGSRNKAYWGLELPLVVRGAELSPATLYATARLLRRPATRHACYRPANAARPRTGCAPAALALSERGIAIKADGIFGRTSANLLRDYQLSAGLPRDRGGRSGADRQLVT